MTHPRDPAASTQRNAAALTYRPDIDGLRAIAVLAVLGFHAFPNFVPGGFVGVDVFFVISGYLITALLLGDLRDGRIRMAAFYRRRLKRIVPSLLVVTSSCLAFGWFVMLGNEFRQLGRHTVGASLFVANLVFWGESGYFDTSAEAKPLLHLWSLGIEEQFYILFPMVLLLWRRWRSGPQALIVAAICLSLACNVALIHLDAVGTFYSPLTRFWELLAGGALASLRAAGHDAYEWEGGVTRLRSIQARYRNALAWLGIVAIAVAIVAYNKTLAYPGVRAVLPVAGTCLLIAAGPSAAVNRFILSRQPLVWIGLISYPLYLWHWPILKFFLMVQGDLTTAAERIGLIGASFLLAWATYRFVELPVRFNDRTRSAALIVMMGVLALIGASAATGSLPSRQRAAGLDRIVRAATDWQFPSPQLRMSLYEGRRIYEQSTPHRETTLFIGDSNVEQYAPRITALLSENPNQYRSVVFATRGGCLPVPTWNPDSLSCPDRLASVLRYARDPRVDTVVVGAYWLALPEGQVRDEAMVSLGRVIADLSRTKRVFLLLNIPAGPEFDPRSMFTGSRLRTLAPKQSPDQLSLAGFLRTYQPLRAALIAIASANGAKVIDPLPWLCKDGTCPVLSDDGQPLYMDEHHMRPFHVVRSTGYVDETVTFPGARAPAALVSNQ